LLVPEFNESNEVAVTEKRSPPELDRVQPAGINQVVEIASPDRQKLAALVNSH
jgi:hypothetical protein